MLETTTIIMMVLILGAIWGGCGYFLSRAFRAQKAQK